MAAAKQKGQSRVSSSFIIRFHFSVCCYEISYTCLWSHSTFNSRSSKLDHGTRGSNSMLISELGYSFPSHHCEYILKMYVWLCYCCDQHILTVYLLLIAGLFATTNLTGPHVSHWCLSSTHCAPCRLPISSASISPVCVTITTHPPSSCIYHTHHLPHITLPIPYLIQPHTHHTHTHTHTRSLTSHPGQRGFWFSGGSPYWPTLFMDTFQWTSLMHASFQQQTSFGVWCFSSSVTSFLWITSRMSLYCIVLGRPWSPSPWSFGFLAYRSFAMVIHSNMQI